MSESPEHAVDQDTTNDNVHQDENSVGVEQESTSEELQPVPVADKTEVDGTVDVDEQGAGEAVREGGDEEIDGVIGAAAGTSRSNPDATQETDSIDTSDQQQQDLRDTAKADTGVAANEEISSTPVITESNPLEATGSALDPLVRAVTPSSRTSTPPLGQLAKKKFSSVNVNQKFLSKAASPAPAPGATKVASLNGKSVSLLSSSAISYSIAGRPAATPVPISSSSSRLLSTKLTTVPTSKSSTSPNPPGASPASAHSSPWAKPALPPADPAPPAPTINTLHHPAPSRARVLGTTTAPPVAMGSGLGITASAPRPAWKAMPGDPRRAGLGSARDFPTANEVAEGKKAAAAAAQAQAAHNQAILQGLNAFTHLEPGAHRWDEEDEDDDVMDFGDGSLPLHHDTPPVAEPTRPEASNDKPVPKSERFAADDFDRSWPRKAPIPVERPPPSERERDPRRSDAEGRVLFNASSNRLEPQANRQQPAPQPTRLMSRPSEPPARENRQASGPPRGFDRPLPPHLQGGADTGRMLPPHMSGSGPISENRPLPDSTAPSQNTQQRQAWGEARSQERPPPHPPHLAGRRELPPQSAAFDHARSPPQPSTHMPPRRSFSQITAPPPPPPPATGAATLPGPPAPPGVDSQSAEMHSAAEKARLRRLAEEAEREAAAERARRKARELEERLQLKTSASESKTAEPAQATSAPPGIAKTSPQITLATRPKPSTEKVHPPTNSLPPIPPPAAARADTDHVPKGPTRNTEASWRSRMQTAAPAEHVQPVQNVVESVQPTLPVPPASQPVTYQRSPRPTAEQFFDHASTEPVEPIKVQVPFTNNHDSPKHNFDDMLARIQAAMAEARIAPVVLEAVGGPSSETSAKRPSQARAESSQTQQTQELVDIPAVIVVQESDITYPDPPKTPPPAWRTYTVKLPKSQPSRGPIPRHRQRLADAPRAQPPKDWVMSFDPALDGLNLSSLSLAELLLPQTILRRYQRSIDQPPIVSISPRQFEPFEKKGKKKVATREVRPSDIVIPSAPVESLLPSATSSTGLKSQQLRDQRTRQTPSEQPAQSVVAAEEPVVSEPPRKVRSPVKTSAGARAEREGRFNADGVTTDLPERGRLPLSDKPGVRFMVSSELEGDSLLDEVNKMSLETLGEGEDKVEQGQEGDAPKVSGGETPKTPPSLSGVTRSSSPNSSSTPWSKTPLSYPASHSPARSISQQPDHDAIKSVWEHAPGPVSLASTSQQLNAAVSGPVTDSSTPVYPSLNAPSSSDLPGPSQPLPAGMKMAFSNSQSHSHSHSQSQYSSPGAVAVAVHPHPQSYGARQSPAYGQLQFSPQSLTSPDPHSQAQAHMMGLTYSHQTPRTSNVNGSFQQSAGGLWSNTSFGSSMASPGYGYSASHVHAQGKPMSMTSGGGGDKMVGYTNTKDGIVYAAGTSGGEYRYPQQYSQAQVQVQGQNPQYASAAPGYGRGVVGVSNPSYGYNYSSGVPGTTMTTSVGGRSQGRFAQANGVGDYSQAYNHGHDVQGGGGGGYYGGLAQNQSPGQGQGQGGYQQQQQQQQQQGYSGRGMGARKMW